MAGKLHDVFYEEFPLFFDEPKVVNAYLNNLDWDFKEEVTRFFGHDLHPYPAKFIPQIPGSIISLLSSSGELVFDPFGGCGTTALEAIRLGRRALSLDANPIAALIGRVKTIKMDSEIYTELSVLNNFFKSVLNSLPPDTSTFIEKYGKYAPIIVNREKWFPDTSFGELSYIKYKINQLGHPSVKDISFLILSRTILGASFQDSETRYKSVQRNIPIGETIKRFLREYEIVLHSITANEFSARYGIAEFLISDIKKVGKNIIEDESIDLIVTSPPYGNSMDYHLYHRFRLLWLGYDPVSFGNQEIGSHLKHQRESNGFDNYFNDLVQSINIMHRILKNGRYAAIVIGDSIYKGNTYKTSKYIINYALKNGFDYAFSIERNIHKSKRSFNVSSRRIQKEDIVFLRKANNQTHFNFISPSYKLWPYEKEIQKLEIDSINKNKKLLNINHLNKTKSLVFTHYIENIKSGYKEPTWQAILENGMASNLSNRKDPKYVTHGIHPYKGKFYPQLAKGLINISMIKKGSKILDPFCGSGTTLLEGYLNGYLTYGCDMNPVAVKIAKVKCNILDEDPKNVTEIIRSILNFLDQYNCKSEDPNFEQFNQDCLDEIEKWFSKPVMNKINWILKIIRNRSEGIIKDFLEIILSSIIRDVSNQEPTDLRIRYRKEFLNDADVIGLYKEKLEMQFHRIEKFWKCRGYAPNNFFVSRAVLGDNRDSSTYTSLGLKTGEVDLVLTSPPYAMALPYIDTDRLSLLTIFGLNSSNRRPLENNLTGSREIRESIKNNLEKELIEKNILPDECKIYIRNLYEKIKKSSDSGFRKKNMPSLIYRFLKDMNEMFSQLKSLCHNNTDIMMVIGDNTMTIDSKNILIPTTNLIEKIAYSHSFKLIDKIDITVTTENYCHIKNSITENVVLRLQRKKIV